MFSKYDEIRARRARGDKGFTLIELLVVVVIIGILIAIAIPVYLNYQKSAANKSAESDVRNAVAAIAQAQADCGAFPNVPAAAETAAFDLTCSNDGGTTSAKVVVSEGNSIIFTAPDTDNQYTVTGVAGDPGDTTYVYTSNDGKITGSPTTAPAA